MATTPGWDFFPTVFANMAHQHAPQSVWPVVAPNPACPVCGDHRQAPLTAEQGRAVARGLQQLVDEASAESGTAEAGSHPRWPGSAGRQRNRALTRAAALLAGLVAGAVWTRLRRGPKLRGKIAAAARRGPDGVRRVR